jgi:hypothetical protein
MKLLLDECVTRRLKREFTGHETTTVDEAGLKGVKNGRLLFAAAGHYDVLVTVDQSMPYQQNLTNMNIAILILAAKRNDYLSLRPLVSQALDALKQIRPGEVLVIQARS